MKNAKKIILFIILFGVVVLLAQSVSASKVIIDEHFNWDAGTPDNANWTFETGDITASGTGELYALGSVGFWLNQTRLELDYNYSIYMNISVKEGDNVYSLTFMNKSDNTTSDHVSIYLKVRLASNLEFQQLTNQDVSSSVDNYAGYSHFNGINISINRTDRKAYVAVNGTNVGNFNYYGTGIASGNEPYFIIFSGRYIPINNGMDINISRLEIRNLSAPSVNTTPPQINMSLNDTSLTANDGVNVTANVSDSSGLSFCMFIINQTGKNEFFNKTITGTNDQCSQNFTINGNDIMINFTLIVNDTKNFKNRTQKLIFTGDTTAPTLDTCTISSTSITNSAGNTINFTCNATDSGIIESMCFDLNGTTLNATKCFVITQGSTVTASYIIYKREETLTAGSESVMNVTIKDTSGNKKVNSTSHHWVVTSEPPTPTTTTSGGDSGGVTVKAGEKITCEGEGINYTITNIQRKLRFGYSLITDLKNTRKKCRDILLLNKGIKNLTLTLECIDTGENQTSGFCNYVDLSETKVVLPPNIQIEKIVKMCILPLGDDIEGDKFFFSIRTNDHLNLCPSQLGNKLELGIFLPKFASWRKVGNLNYPIIAPAFLLAIVFFLIPFFSLKSLGVVRVIISFITGITTFILFLIFM